MADKTSTGAAHADLENSVVTTAGASSVDTIKILWDDATDKLSLMDAFEKARNAFLTYLATR